MHSQNFILICLVFIAQDLCSPPLPSFALLSPGFSKTRDPNAAKPGPAYAGAGFDGLGYGLRGKTPGKPVPFTSYYLLNPELCLLNPDLWLDLRRYQ